jgi:hypothetical protein
VNCEFSQNTDTLISSLTVDNLAMLSTSLYCIMSALRLCQMRKEGAWVKIGTINEAMNVEFHFYKNQFRASNLIRTPVPDI